MDLTSKTVTLANDAISGNNVHGGVISNFASTGIDDNSSATAITILSDGKVGIGTNNPSGPLIVHGNSSNTDAESDLGLYNHFLNTNTNVNTGSAIVLGSNSNPGTAIYAQRIGSNNEHKMGFQTRNSSGSSTTRMTILGSGNVGIGFTSPNEKLHVNGVIEASGGFKLASHPILDYTGFDGGYSTRLGSTGTSTLNATQIFAGGSVQATFKGGKVGIGTTGPDGILNVVSTAHNNGAIFDSTGTAQIWLRDTNATSNQRNWGLQLK